ncbi:MAG: hypothetical protein ACREV9_16735 [Burkholderiales bacterium]
MRHNLQPTTQVRRAQLANAVQLYKALGGGDYGNEKSAAFQKQ